MAIDAGLGLAARVLLASIFTRALYAKYRHREEFFGVVANYRLLPVSLAREAAWLVLVLEGLVVLSLVSGYAMAWGATLAGVLLCLFAFAIGINLVRGRTEIDCGCFHGELRQPIGPELLVRNALLAATACLPLLTDTTSAGTLQLVNGFGAGMSVFFLYLVGERFGAARRQAALLRARGS